MPNVLWVRARLLAPELCGDVTLTAERIEAGQLQLTLVRERPSDKRVCISSGGHHVVRGTVYPLDSRVYRVRARYRYLRTDGSAQIDTLLADTPVAVR